VISVKIKENEHLLLRHSAKAQVNPILTTQNKKFNESWKWKKYY